MTLSPELLDAAPAAEHLEEMIERWSPDDEGFARLSAAMERLNACPPLPIGAAASTWQALRMRGPGGEATVYAFRRDDPDLGARGLWMRGRLESVWLRTHERIWVQDGDARWSRPYDQPPPTGLPVDLAGMLDALLEEVRESVDDDTRSKIDAARDVR